MTATVSYLENSKIYGYVLLLLTILFGFRVLAQLVQAWYPVDFLPPFQAWHSGALPYWVLVLTQGFILTLCVRIIWGIMRGRIVPSLRKGKFYLFLGTIYFSVMCVRLIIGTTMAPDHYWLGASLPTVFHLILASCVLAYGHFHFSYGYNRSVSKRLCA